LSPCSQLRPEIKLRRFANEDRKNIGRILRRWPGCGVGVPWPWQSRRLRPTPKLQVRKRDARGRTTGRSGELESHRRAEAKVKDIFADAKTKGQAVSSDTTLSE